MDTTDILIHDINYTLSDIIRVFLVTVKQSPKHMNVLARRANVRTEHIKRMHRFYEIIYFLQEAAYKDAYEVIANSGKAKRCENSAGDDIYVD